jgi:O-antigen ligase
MHLFTNFNRVKALPAIFYFSLIWMSGFFYFPTGQLHNQAYILLIVIPSVWLIATSNIAIKQFFNSKLFCLTFAFCMYYAISTFWGTYADFNLQLSELKRVIYLYCFWLVIFITYYLDDKKLVKLGKTLLISAVVGLCLNVIFFIYFSQHAVDARFYGFGRLRNELWVAALFGAMAILSLTLSFHSHSRNRSYLYLILYCVFFAATLLTHSRGPILSMIAVSFLVIFTSKISLKSKLLITFFATLLAIAPFVFQAHFIQSDISRGQSYRLDLWLGFLELTKNHIILGQGAGTNVFIQAPGEFVHGWSHYHNVYLGSFVELGLVGLLFHISLVFFTCIVGWRYRGDSAANAALMIFIFSSLIGITYGQGVITRINAQWIVFWLPLAIIIMRDLERLNIERFSLNKLD